MSAEKRKTALSRVFADKAFIKNLVRIAVPIAMQNLIVSSLSFVDTVMIGQLGETEIAAVGLGNQVFFLILIMIFGMGSGTAVFVAQYWGKNDAAGIRRSLGICLTGSLILASFFSAASIFAPEKVLALFTLDQAVIDTGKDYLVFVGISYLFTAVSTSFSTALRSTERPNIPMYASSVSLILNSLLNWVLIFGKLGFPALGVKGAAIATTISRLAETGILIAIVYRRGGPLAGSLADFFSIDFAFVRRFVRTAFPVLMNETVWSLGMTVYKAIYARMGTSVLASTNIAETLINLIFVVFIGTGNAAAVIIGKKIGGGEEDRAQEYAKHFSVMSVAFALPLGAVMAALAPVVPMAFNVSPEVGRATRNILLVIACYLPFKALNMHTVVGIMRSGGDTTFAFCLDLCGVWLIGVPLAYICGLRMGLPIHIVYIFSQSEEAVKSLIGIGRVLSRKWIHNVTEAEK